MQVGVVWRGMTGRKANARQRGNGSSTRKAVGMASVVPSFSLSYSDLRQPPVDQRTNIRSIHTTSNKATMANTIWPIHWPGVPGLPRLNTQQW
jgi:hypothetical protein